MLFGCPGKAVRVRSASYPRRTQHETRNLRNRPGASVSPAAIVTASDSGIGQETAKELAKNGFDIGITYHEDEAGAQETLMVVEEVGRRGEVRRLDLTDLPDAADVVDELADALGGVDVLVNNAGTNDPTGEFLKLSYDE